MAHRSRSTGSLLADSVVNTIQILGILLDIISVDFIIPLLAPIYTRLGSNQAAREDLGEQLSLVPVKNVFPITELARFTKST